MKKTAVLLVVLMFCCSGLVMAQTNILVYSETFENGATSILLNTSSVGGNSGPNMWVVNDNYTGSSQYPDTPNQNNTSGGTINNAPYSKYLHINNASSGVLNSNYDPTAPSDHFTEIATGLCTQGMTDVKLTFFYICEGSPNALGEIYYSKDNGPWISTGTQLNNQSIWQYIIIQDTAFNNVANLRFGFRWVNDQGTQAPNLSLGIDDIFVTGYFDNFNTGFNVIIDSVAPNPICQNFGLYIYYHLTAPICGNGFYEVQLSNGNGSFLAPTSLGIYMASNSWMNGVLWPVIPSATISDSCYKVRIHYYYTDYALNFYSNNSPCIFVLQCPNTITTNQPVVTMSPDSLCMGSVIDVPFYSTGVFQGNNHYIAQLSDSTGAFVGTLNILGDVPNSNTYDPLLNSPPGSVSGLLNENNQPVPDGCNYYIRVVSTNPVAVGLQWGPICIKHCDIETNHKQDLHACLTSTTGYSTTIYTNIHYYDSSATAAVYDPSANQFMLEVHSAQNFAVIPPVGCIGSITASSDTSFVVTIPDATQLGTLGLQPGLYYVRIVATNSDHPYDLNGTIIRLLIGAPADNLWILQSPADSVLCIGDAVFFYPIPYNAGPPMNSTYQWYLNNQLFSTQPAIGILFNGAGNYNLTVRETNYGCAGPLVANSVILHVLAPPTAIIQGPLEVCKGDTIYYFSTFHPNYYYEWSMTGGALIDTANNEMYIRFDTVGIYTINLLTLNKCGQAIGHRNVIVSDHPDPSFTTQPALVCTGDSILVFYSGTTPAPLDYSWTFGGGSAVPGGTSPGPHHVTWSTPGVYNVILDISQYSCHSKDTNQVTVIQKPQPVFSANGFCPGLPTSFVDSTGGNLTSRTWNFGDGSLISDLVNPVHIYADSGHYLVQLTVSNGICSDSVVDTVVIAMKPTSQFMVEEPICLGQTTLVSYTGNAGPNAFYTWHFPGAIPDSAIGQGPFTLAWADSGNYLFSLSVIQSTCPSDTSMKSVKVKVCSLTIPNVITPNGDGKNETFRVGGLETYTESALYIYNRWGKMIYSSKDYQNDWNGADSPDGVYYYVLLMKDGTKYRGTITVLR